jgi:hypothetical protein
MTAERLNNTSTATEAANSRQQERKRFWNKMIAGGAIVFGAAWALGAVLPAFAAWAALGEKSVVLLGKLLSVAKTAGVALLGVGAGGRLLAEVK